MRKDLSLASHPWPPIRFEPMTTPNADESHGVILDSINDGVFTVDREWKITSFNRAAERITGVKRQEAVGTSVLRGVPRQHL